MELNKWVASIGSIVRTRVVADHAVLKQSVRDGQAGGIMETLNQDLRFALGSKAIEAMRGVSSAGEEDERPAGAAQSKTSS